MMYGFECGTSPGPDGSCHVPNLVDVDCKYTN